jgi:hypothetical protein
MTVLPIEPKAVTEIKLQIIFATRPNVDRTHRHGCARSWSGDGPAERRSQSSSESRFSACYRNISDPVRRVDGSLRSAQNSIVRVMFPRSASSGMSVPLMLWMTRSRHLRMAPTGPSHGRCSNKLQMQQQIVERVLLTFVSSFAGP